MIALLSRSQVGCPVQYDGLADRLGDTNEPAAAFVNGAPARALVIPMVATRLSL
jgi:hypothetical protein